MKNKFKWGGLLAMVGFLGLTSGTASATPIDFSFTNVGTADIGHITSCASASQPSCNILNTSGSFWVGGAIVGAFQGTMKVVGISFGFSDVDSAGSSWSFLDSSGTNSLFGTLSGDLLGFVQAGGGGQLHYAVDGGTGFFTGANGYGDSHYGYLGTSYFETGDLHVDWGALSVPEPAVTMMLIAGLGMVGFMAYRRRRLPSRF